MSQLAQSHLYLETDSFSLGEWRWSWELKSTSIDLNDNNRSNTERPDGERPVRCPRRFSEPFPTSWRRDVRLILILPKFNRRNSAMIDTLNPRRCSRVIENIPKWKKNNNRRRYRRTQLYLIYPPRTTSTGRIEQLLRLSASILQFSTRTNQIDLRLQPVHQNLRHSSRSDRFHLCRNYFMQSLRTYPHFPELVYHGTEMSSMRNIFRYGLMVPNQRHPIFADAPVIKSRTGRAYGEGIYCTHQVLRALENLHETNTILVCAALPERHGPYSTLAHSVGDVLVLKNESRIIPLFLLDVQCLRHPNHPWYDYEKTLVVRRKKPERRTSNSISRKYLRKVLDRINNETRKPVRQWLDDW